MDTVIGDGGSSPWGFEYWQNDTPYLLRFIESERLDPTADPDAEFYGATAWFENVPYYWLHTTILHDATLFATGGSGLRAGFGDADGADQQTNTALLARIGAWLDDRDSKPETIAAAQLAQRLAWDGHDNAMDNADTERHPLDALFWRRHVDLDPLDGVTDNVLAPLSSLSEVPTHYCSAHDGLFMMRAGWGTDDSTEVDDPYFAMRGGGAKGNHQDPDAGSFVLWADGPLVDEGDYNNQTAKRTALHSTLLVDGWGQHGDWWSETEAAPEGAGNDGQALAYIDIKGPTYSGNAIDVVGVATDLTQLYRMDATDNDRVSGTAAWASQAESGGRTLDELQRYAIWIGDPTPTNGSGAVLIYDRWKQTLPGGAQPLPIEWRMVVANRMPSTGERLSCSFLDHGGTYNYEYGTSTAQITYTETKSLDDVSISGPTPEDFNRSYYPDPSDVVTPLYWPACDTDGTMSGSPYGGTKFISGLGTSGVTIDPDDSYQGRLQLRALEFAGTWSSLQVANKNEVLGHAVKRTKSGEDAYMLNALLPMVDAGPAAQVTIFSSITSGSKVRVLSTATTSSANNYDVTAMFHDPSGTYPPLVSDGVGMSVKGHVGVVAHKGSDVYGAQVLHGAAVTFGGVTLVEALEASLPGTPPRYGSDFGVTWGTHTVYGTVHPRPDIGSTKVTVWLPSSWGATSVASYEFDPPGAEVTVPSVPASSGRLEFVVDEAATFRVSFTTPSAADHVHSSCSVP